MTRKEFDKSFQHVLNEFINLESIYCYTCCLMIDHMGAKTCIAYSKFIEPFRTKSRVNLLDSSLYCDTIMNPFNSIPTLDGIRALLLSNFYEEAIRTKEYLKW